MPVKGNRSGALDPSRSSEVTALRVNWLVCLVICTLLMASSGCETPLQPGLPSSDGGVYGVTGGSFRGRWWNFYERGVSFEDGQFWEKAETDLREAVRLRPDDRRRARTYGMHFVDYFPHRELGVVLFRQGRYGEAVQELQASLATEKSARAEFYLDMARSRLLHEKGGDLPAPGIQVDFPPQDFLTNAFSVQVSGTVWSDAYVKRVMVNDVPIRLDLAEPSVPFRVDIPLEPGPNVIRVVSTDLMEKTSFTERRVYLDRQGPVLGIEEVTAVKSPVGLKLKLRGYAGDDSGVLRVTVNGRPILEAAERKVQLDHTVPYPDDGAFFLLEAEDLVGNRTVAEIPLDQGGKGLQRTQLAAVDCSLFKLALDRSPPRDTIPPFIEIRDLSEDQQTFSDQVYLEGRVRDEGGVASLSINADPILRWPGRQVYFSYLAKLREGENVFLIVSTDQAGNRSEKQIRFHKKVHAVRQVESRMTVALLPLERKGASGFAADAVEEGLLSELVGGSRFRVVERRRLEEVLREQKLGRSELADQEAALRVGKIIASHAVIMGSVLEWERSLEIYLRVVDVETSLILTAVDVYGEETSLDLLRVLCQGLMLKLLDELPLVEGTVIGVRGETGTVDLGREKRVKRGMRVIVFREGEPVRHPLTGLTLGTEVEETGRGVIQVVHEKMSDLALTGRGTPGGVQPLQKAITQ